MEAKNLTGNLDALPAEIRRKIYEYCFTFTSLTCKGILVRGRGWRGQWRVRERDRYLTVTSQLGPTLVCHQMRKETVSLLMHLNNPSCGNQHRDVEPHYELSIGPRILTDSCSWVSKVLSNTASPFLTQSTAFILNLWVHPGLLDTMTTEEWSKFEEMASQLASLDSPGRAKLIVVLHFYIGYESLLCDLRGSALLRPYGSIVFRPGESDGFAETEVAAAFGMRGFTLGHHDSHARCGIRASRERSLVRLNDTRKLAELVVGMVKRK